ncbi:MAG: FGGY family carbohydrate kinase [Armatimonadota bacterium]|nr:FGGY family carbohydrate kinase [Armatimonadota bacterium]
MGLLIGLDIGTTKICAVALDASNGQLTAVEDTLNDTQLSSQPDAAEQDAQGIIDKSHGLLSRLLQRPELKGQEILAVGVTGQMHGVVIADRAGKPITPLVTWQDGRGAKPYKSTSHSYAEELANRLGEDALAASGCRPATGYGAVTLLQMSEEGNIPNNGKALTIHDLLVQSLCGSIVTDPTDAASWGIFDVRDGSRWLLEAQSVLKLPEGMLPEVIPTGSIAGQITAEAELATGLQMGIPIAVAFGDNQASFLGSVPSLRESLLMNLGTGGQMSVPTNHFNRAQGLDTRPLVKGQWLLVGASLCGGRAYQILESFFASIGQDLFGILYKAALYDLMNKLAAHADDDCGGLAASTLFEGTRVDPARRGCIGNIDSKNFTVANLTRAVIIGMVEELAAFYEVARQAGAAPKYLAGSGNAIRRNAVVRQEIEKRVGMPLQMPPHPEEAAVGAALAGGVAAGVYCDWNAAGNTLYPWQ